METKNIEIGSGLGAVGAGTGTENEKLKVKNEKLGEGGKGNGEFEIENLRFEKGGGGRKRTRRPRSDTAVRQLSPEQRAKIDGWLFDAHLSYDDVSALCEQELGVKITAGCIGAYCRQEQGARAVRKAADGNGYVTMLESMNQMVLRAVERVEIGDDPRVLAAFARVLVSARQEANHALRASTTREKFEFDAATACLIHQVKVQSIAADEALDDGERIMKIREELFGPNLPQ